MGGGGDGKRRGCGSHTLTHRFLYWTSFDDGIPTIHKLLMNGSETSTVFWTGNVTEGAPKNLLVAYRNITLTHTTAPDSLYWTTSGTNGRGGTVYQASLEGGPPTPAVVVLALDSTTAAIAVLGDYLYYSVSGDLAVSRKLITDPSVTNTNPSDVTVIGSGMGRRGEGFVGRGTCMCEEQRVEGAGRVGGRGACV